MAGPRLAARAVIVEAGRILLVNAYPGRFDLWCAPGGGVERHQSLHENLARELFEETGLRVSVGALCLVNEFHDPEEDFHQVDLFFRAEVIEGVLDAGWRDPEDVVQARRWFSREEAAAVDLRPLSLLDVGFGGGAAAQYDALERKLP